jgi:hypothetical protein
MAVKLAEWFSILKGTAGDHTIKAHPATPHHPCPYGKGVVTRKDEELAELRQHR